MADSEGILFKIDFKTFWSLVGPTHILEHDITTLDYQTKTISPTSFIMDFK